MNPRDRYCNFCRNSGHFESDCFRKQTKPNGSGPTGRSEVRKSPKVVCNWCRKKGHIESECRGKSSGRVPQQVPKPNTGRVSTVEEADEENTPDETEDPEHFLDSEIPGEEDH